MTELPKGWAPACLSDICDINPRVDKSAIDQSQLVSFVPMHAVEAENGRIDVSATRPFGEVKQGYTPFRTGDILFAKITPCMENGKMAIVPRMPSEYGFGSTEFHVLRALCGVEPSFIYHIVSNQGFRYLAEHHMTGAVGQKRVPASLLSDHPVAVPPLNEQRRIVAKIEAMFERIDKGVESLVVAKTTLGLYRQSLLKSAFEGRLTAAWRSQNPDKLECTKALLSRIQKERETRYKSALDDWQTALSEWRANGEVGRKPGKPSRPADIVPQHITEDAKPDHPASWGSLRLGGLNIVISDGPFGSNLKTSDYTTAGIQVVRLENIGYGQFITGKQTFVSQEKYETIAGHTIYPGTIVVSSFVTDAVRSCVVPASVPIAVNKADCFAVVVEGERTSREFLAYYLQCGQVFKQLEGLIHGVGRPRINTTQLKELHFPICSPAEQAEITRILDARLTAADAMEAEINAALLRAEALRQSILKQAFAGTLVPQDPTDEPATTLLARIKAERAKAGKNKQRRTAHA